LLHAEPDQTVVKHTNNVTQAEAKEAIALSEIGTAECKAESQQLRQQLDELAAMKEMAQGGILTQREIAIVQSLSGS
jgi:hypothetical protein